MKKLALLLFFKLIFLFNFANGEIIGIREEEKQFGQWKVFCEIDEMMDSAYCKIANKFFDQTSVLTIQPTKNSASQFFIIIPQIEIGNFVAARIDNGDLILSRNILKKDFGMIPFEDAQKNSLFLQMKKGDFLYFRFKLQNNDKEITVKLNLNDFRDALNYYNKRTKNN